MDFRTLLLRYRGRGYIPSINVLALDPGETTGLAFFNAATLEDWKQLNTKELSECPEILAEALDLYKPDFIAIEAYKVYGWKKDSHAWSTLHTPQLIGMIKGMSIMGQYPLEERMAVEAKTFCTDDKLEEWGLYKPGMKHARDAIRHGCFAYLFSKHPVFTQANNKEQ